MMCATCHIMWFHFEHHGLMTCERCHNAAGWGQSNDNADEKLAASTGPRRLPTQTASHDRGLTASRGSNAGAEPNAAGKTNATASSNVNNNATNGNTQEERQMNDAAVSDNVHVHNKTGKDKIKVTPLTAADKTTDAFGPPGNGTSPTAKIPCKFYQVG